MRRRGQHAKAKVEAKLRVAHKSRRRGTSRVGDLEKCLAEALKREAETHEQQAATAEILRVISSSRTDVEPVFQMILSSTNRLCEASFSVLWLWDGEALVPAAHVNVSPGMAERLRTSHARPRRGATPVALTALEKTVIHIPDVLEDPRFSPSDVPSYQLEGARSILAVPMLHEGSLVGVINTWRRESRAFTENQVELLKTFADQAVIAVENARLFKELQGRNADLADALARQTATGEILRVVSSSPTDVQPVFDAIVRSAVKLCDGLFSTAFRFDGELLHLAAQHNVSVEGLAEFRRIYPARPPGVSRSGGPSSSVRSSIYRMSTSIPRTSIQCWPA